MLMIDCIRLAAGPHWSPEEIHLETSLYDLLEQRSAIFPGITISRQRFSAIVFDRQLLSVPLACTRQARKNLAEREYQALVATAPALDCPASVQQLVRMLPGEGP